MASESVSALTVVCSGGSCYSCCFYAAASLSEPIGEDATLSLEDLLPSPEEGPDAIYARNVLLDVLDDALDELPANQREVFIAHEWMGRSFKELAEESGISVNTLLSQKRYAVLHLRKRLLAVDENFGKS